MLPKEDRKAMLLRLFNEDTPLMDHSKDRFHNDSRAQPNANIKDEADDIKDEEQEVDADVENKMAVKEEEGKEGNIAAATLGEDMEISENGARDGEREDDVLSDDAVKDEVEDGV